MSSVITFPSDDEIMIIEDSDEEDSKESNSKDSFSSKFSTDNSDGGATIREDTLIRRNTVYQYQQNLTSASSIDNEQTSCRNPYHDKWGNNDSNYRWPSQVPAVAQSVFRLLGYERAPGSRSKFCETCITRATCLTDEEVTEITRQAKLSRRQSENAVIQVQLKKLEKMNISEEEKAHQAKQLRMLAFVNPGKFMEDFDPEKSTREMKKVNRRIYKERMARKNQIYDETGCLISNQKDLCDCLTVECPGCHFPCPKCQSQKCGTDCRNNRRWIYEYIEIEGTGTIKSWSQSDMK